MSNTNQTQTAPLWRVLNEQRIGGVWIAGNMPNGLVTQNCLFQNGCLIGRMQVNSYFTSAESEINAAYTALAVNNLASLAEALEAMLADFSDFDEEDAARKKATTALARIS